MADVETKETKVVASPEKKVVEEEKKKVVEEAEEVDEDSRASENGDSKEAKENGSAEEKDSDEKEAESTENGSTDTPAVDACSIKRKSTAGVEVAEESAVDGVSPEKKAKLDEKPAAVAVEAESNGDTETAA